MTGSTPLRARRAPLRRAAADSLAVAALALGLLWPALHNGLPLLFPDTGGYVEAASRLYDLAGRPLAYSLLVRLGLALRPSLWSVAILQALVTAALVSRLTWLLFPHARWRAWATVALCLVGVSSLPRYASWIMADAICAWLWLGACLWALAPGRLERAIALGVVAFTAASHLTLLPVLAFAALLTFLAWGLTGPSLRARLCRGRGLALGLLGGGACFAVLGWVDAYHTPAELAGSPSWRYVIGRLHVSGELADTLERHCREKRWRMCPYRELVRANESDPIWLLWDPSRPPGLILALGRQGSEEQREIALIALREGAPGYLASSLRNAWRQLWWVTHGTDPMPPSQRARLPARDRASAAASRQGRGQVYTTLRLALLPGAWDPRLDTALHGALLVAAGAALALALRRRSERWTLLLTSLLAFQLGNALAVGFGTPPLPRYQARISWTLLFALTLLAFEGWQRLQERPGAATAPARSSP